MSLPTDPQLLEQQFAQEAKEAKYRFIGALALLVLALGTLPFVLNSPPRPAPTLAIEIAKPAKDAAMPALSTPTLSPTTLPDTALSSPSAGASPVVAPPATLPPATVTKPPLAFAQDIKQEATTDKAKFAIQAGSFADPSKAQAASEKLTHAGITHSTVQTTNRKGEPRTRIRVEGFASEREAKALAEKIKTLGLETSVMKL